MVVVASVPVTNDIRAGNDLTDAIVTAAAESAESGFSTGEKTGSMTPGTPSSDNAKGSNENENDSIDEKKTSPLNDVQDNSLSSTAKSIMSNIDNENYDKNKVNNSAENVNNDNHDENNDENENESNKQSDSDDSGDSDSTSSGDDSDSDSESDKPDDGISAYERLRIERIRRNEERLKQLGLVDPNKKLLPPKKKKRVSLGASQKRSKENFVPQRSQPKRSAKEKVIQGELLSEGGQKIDFRRSWPMRPSYKDRFGRQDKTKAIPQKDRYSKRYRCGECRACKRQTDCQTCCYCSFNQRKSSSCTTRRRCLFRMCLRRLVDVEVEIEPEVEENSNDTTETKAPVDESAAKATTDVDNAIDKGGNANDALNHDGSGDFDKDNAIVAQGIDDNAHTKADEDDQPQEKLHNSKSDIVHNPSAQDSACTEEEGENAKTEEVAHKKVPIDDSEYFSSYQNEEGESGLPKWLDEFYKFMATIPHGPMNRVSGQKNADNTMSQVCKLVSGEGVTYHLWPEGTHFKRGIKIHLGMDLTTLHQEAVAMERRYEDRRKGSLLRHPIAKMICYKEWIANGKPAAPEEPPMSPLLSLPPPTNDRSDTIKNENSKASQLKKRFVAMTIEQRIKPNRVRWASDALHVSPDAVASGADVAANMTTSRVANDDDQNATNKSLDERNSVNDSKSTGRNKTESDLKNHDKHITINDDVKNMNNMEIAKAADAKIGNNTSHGDDKENMKELFSNSSGEIESDKDAVGAAMNETISEKVTATKESTENIASATSEAGSHDHSSTNVLKNDLDTRKNKCGHNDNINMMPSSCSVCSGGGDLICCDGCNRGFHSNCHYPKIKEIPMGEWFCRDCERKKKKPKRPINSDGPKREIVVKHKLFQGEHDDDCYICRLGGDLICCDFCEKSFHLECHIPPLPFVPEGIWKCCECLAVERKKKSRCGECEACTREDCGKCKFCLDKPKFGGFNTLRQVCMKKVCPYPRFAPPASFISVAGTVTGKGIPGMLFPESKLVSSTRRKRGRPRKSEYTENLTIIGNAKKRGRPRKSVDGDDVAMNSNQFAVSTKRKRGRPRKSVDRGDLGMNSNQVATPIKKKRGRPRKSVDGDDLAMNSNQIAAFTKKKRGRPRKSVDRGDLGMNSSQITTPIKKKRGRPRKSVDGNDVAMDSIHVASPIQKKWGRSRKSVEGDSLTTNSNQIATSTKKKRGRPRKSAESGEIHESKRVKIEADEDKSMNQPVVFSFKISSFKTAYKDPESVKIRKVIKGALRDPADSKAVDKACERLRKCMKSVETVKTVMLFGGVEMLCNAMRDHLDKNILQAEACCTLAEMIWVFPAISKKLAHMGVIDLIVTSIHSCPSNSKVQQMGCGALGAFSYDANFTQQIMDAGGVQAVIAAMERFPKKVAVLMEGCYFFQNLIVRSADALSAVSNSQVVPIILETMSTENLDTDILLSMCGLIANLAVNKEAKEFIGQSNAISATISVLNSTDDGGVKQAACTVLKNLAIGSSGNQTKIAENGGIDALFGAIRTHPSDALLLILSFNVMKELCVNDEDIAHEIVRNGGIKIILKAMQKNSELATMQVAACQIIGYLLLEGKSEIHAPKLVKAIVTAMKNHSEDSDVQIQGCDALFELSQISTTRLILKKQETQEILLRAKSYFKSCESDVDDIIAASKK